MSPVKVIPRTSTQVTVTQTGATPANPLATPVVAVTQGRIPGPKGDKGDKGDDKLFTGETPPLPRGNYEVWVKRAPGG